MSAYPQILGVYVRNVTADVGAGTTRGSYDQKTYWYVRRTGDDAFEVQPINANHVPSGLRSVFGKGEFMAAFSPEPAYYERNTLPPSSRCKRRSPRARSSSPWGAWTRPSAPSSRR
ncbi:hypothetical protein [Desulfocurvus sp.]|uniref:hypothetical protein n=1 Tax=Desulfocurvus sp. TaxID=2871698 RepID=UPI0025C54599|nr:hypothetical protein [Desulfocurvus sp.]MCK9240776.1 hypothetical protein [Desulfocurvus sp.]